ncbi:hypothetical protein [Bradyrhizobium sp. McL0616]|uniref:hypothetical protein n=1 Tax=Bradyrhizobium sp. McL0616 TaxID=3415674 RepID=UPI003CF9A0F6
MFRRQSGEEAGPTHSDPEPTLRAPSVREKLDCARGALAALEEQVAEFALEAAERKPGAADKLAGHRAKTEAAKTAADELAAALRLTEQPIIPPATALPSTPTEAATRLDQLKADPKWASSFVGGGPAQLQEFRDLHEIVAKGDHVDVAMSGLHPEQPSSGHREMAGTAAMLRELGIDDRIIKETLTGHM